MASAARKRPQSLREIVRARIVCAGINREAQRWLDQARVQAFESDQPRVKATREQHRADDDDDERLLDQQRRDNATDNHDLVEPQHVGIEFLGR